MSDSDLSETWPKCTACGGSGLDDYENENCLGCGGTGRDPNCCKRCEEPGVGFNDDGDFLCEDCMFEEAIKI